MTQKCKFGYTLETCGDKFEPPCGGKCEFPSKSIQNVKPKPYNNVHKHN